MRKVEFKMKEGKKLGNQSIANRKMDRQCLKESKKIFALLIQHQQNEMHFH